MDRATASRWESIGRWCPELILVGGGLLVGHAALLGVRAVSKLATPPDVFGPTGHLVALVGLFGLYPALVGRTPRVARVGSAVAAVAVAGWGAMTVARSLAIVGVVSSTGDVLPGAFPVLVFGSTILTYGLFGVATVRVDDSPRVVGALVLAPAALIVVALVKAAVTGVTALDGLVIGGGLALSVLALGYTLRTRDRPVDRAVPAGDVTGG